MLLDSYKKMVTIRKFEVKVAELFAAGQIPGFVHLCIGQEAIPVGTCATLREDDYISLHHRAHGHVYAKGCDVKYMMAELFAKKAGYCKGKGGSMHLANMGLRILGANGIVGGSISLATGAALACQLKGEDSVAVAVFGDGAANRGTFHESLNLASIWRLPVIYVCENNFWGVSSHQPEAMAVQNVSERAVSYRMPGVTIDGNDVVAVYETCHEAVKRARSGEGPTLIEAITWRHRGHFEGEHDIYRDPEEHKRWLEKDPIPRLRDQLVKRRSVNETVLDEMERKVDQSISDAVAFAERSPFPDPDEVLEDVYKEKEGGR